MLGARAPSHHTGHIRTREPRPARRFKNLESQGNREADTAGANIAAHSTGLTLTSLEEYSAMGDATVTAAVIAASAALIVSLATAVSSRATDTRSAHRSVLAPFLADLGQHLAGVVATAHVFLKRAAAEQDLGAWRARMLSHADDLMTLRSQVRYPLYGLEEGLRVLSRVSSWTQHFTSQAKMREGRELLEHADRLRSTLDRTVAKSYRRGEPPTRLDRWQVERRAKRVRSFWEGRDPRHSIDDSDLVDDLP